LISDPKTRITNAVNSSEVVTEILATFQDRGHRAYGENVTEQQHGLQCATLAQCNREEPALVAACLLHDYGHLLHDLGENIADHGIDARHEYVGANRLSAWFPPTVVEPIRLHAAAKRYLCWRDPSYYSGLSDASRKSLGLQGGPMSTPEAHAFETHPHFDRSIRLRRYDDLGKNPAMTTPGLEAFRPLLESLVVTQPNGTSGPQ
jgi:phosphonate degradation associated HDIG domain protein